MKRFSVNLFEDNQINVFSLDSENRTENTVMGKRGSLNRQYDGSWESQSVDLDVKKEAAHRFVRVKIPASWGKQAESVAFDPGKILRSHRYLIDYLSSLEGIQWKVIFRKHSLERLVVRGHGKPVHSCFCHFSVLVQLGYPAQRNPIEVGEGNTENLKFNQNGLTLRIQAVLDNHRQSRKKAIDRQVPVVLSSGDGGILFHEILGHSLEADYIYQKMSSIGRDDIGKRIVSENVTLDIRDKNDPFFGNSGEDDEGEGAGFTRLVDRGVLCHLISDFFYQKLLNINHSGHCRVEDYTRIPMPRMFALYLKPGPHDPQELIDSTGYGVYAREFGDGKIFFNKDLFYFNIKAAHLIEGGRVTAPLGHILVRGKISEILNSVEMIANDFRYDKGNSYCNKNGQTLNVRVGQPSVKINNLFVSRDYHD